MAKAKWDIDNQSAPKWEEGQAPCFKLWETEGRLTALLDADMLPYIVGFLHKVSDWEETVQRATNKGIKINSKKFFKFAMRQKACKEAINHCDSLVNSWVIGAGADSAKLYLTTGMRNFRFDVAMSREYKGTRKQPKPPFYSLLRWHLVNKHNAIVARKEEADDLMAIEQYSRNEGLALEGAEQGSEESKRFSDTIIVTKDKDLRMIAGWHSNPSINKGEPFWSDRLGFLEPEYYPEGHSQAGKMKKLSGAGMMFFYAQLLMGDSVDNYTGLPGMGIVSTYNQLRYCKSVKKLHKTVKELYKNKYGSKPFALRSWSRKELKVDWKDMLVEQGRLAWMQTSPNELWESEHVLPAPSKWQPKGYEKIRRAADKDSYI